jgi:L-amino acid N-acyltransferase YncA
MSSPTISIRRAQLEHAKPILEIFAYYVINSIATYCYEPPRIDFFIKKIKRSLDNGRFPFFVAVEEGKVIGYAYGSEYRTLEGYRETIEDSTFIHHEYQQRGIGAMLLGELVEECKRLGYRRLIAVFGSDRDELPGTFRLHERFGFREVGRLTGVGEKFGPSLDTPILQLNLRA